MKFLGKILKNIVPSWRVYTLNFLVYLRIFFSSKVCFCLLADPCNFDVNETSPDLQIEQIELASNLHYSNDFKNSHIVKFYASLNDQTFVNLKQFAKKLLVHFGSTYICEQTFSIMKNTKFKLRTSVESWISFKNFYSWKRTEFGILSRRKHLFH